ncbi:hypothetical protein Ciccas_006170 [Cichlidogyrus casuarinus]|uniref:E3 ubiquitin-protein ligase RNF10 n=1 Tax=Cichlidogyrus casuarinus TaxID=1844966 RepID=A0ABD2Q6W8_9PLAT
MMRRRQRSSISFSDNCFMLSLKNQDFINAKYRLLVRDNIQDLDSYTQCPNKTLPWDEIQVVLTSDSVLPECPICLYPPVAPRMERCGHIYCYPCLLQYIVNDDDGRGFRKCAICDSLIYQSHLKRVALNPLNSPLPGDEITLSLMKKPKNCYQLMDLDQGSAIDTNILCYKKQKFDRIVTASDRELAVIINDELDSLLSQLAVSKVDDMSFELVPFLESCIKSLRTEQTIINTRIKRQEPTPLKEKLNLEEVESEVFLFYQSSDGQDVYLNGLNWRCLNAEFANLPNSIHGKILDLKRCILTPQSRRTLRYLTHLPDGREVLIAELDLTHLLSEVTHNKFASEFAYHAKQRQAQQAKELELTRLKIEQENRPLKFHDGLRLLGNSDLSEAVPQASDFMPLTPHSVNHVNEDRSPTSLPVSFAAVSTLISLLTSTDDQVGCFFCSRQEQNDYVASLFSSDGRRRCVTTLAFAVAHRGPDPAN